MIELLQNPAVTMSAAALGGWMMKMKAAQRETQAAQHAQFIAALVTTSTHNINSADAAAARRSDNFGKWTSRVIAFALILGALALCFAGGIFDAPAIIPTVKESSGFLWGLFGGGSKTVMQEVNGFYHAPELWAGFGHIVAFYFGQRAAKF